MVETPIHIVVVTGGDGKPVMAHPRVLVVAGANSQVRDRADVHRRARTTSTSTTPSRKCVVGEGAIVDFYTDQRESRPGVSRRQPPGARRARRACLRRTRSRPARKIMRHDIGIGLKGEGADCTMNGVYLADGERLMDKHTSLDHAMPHCTSHELYKGILAGKAKAVFNGRIIVRLDAQKTDAKQTNRALLLSDDAHDQLEPAARDLRRRREVHARRGGGAARRRGDVLPAGARPDARPRRATCCCTRLPAKCSRAEDSGAARADRADALHRARARRRRACDDRRHDQAEARQPTARRRSTSRRSARTSRSCRSSCTASRWSISTARTPARSRCRCCKAMDDYYRHANANIHRATHLLSERATALYEGARAKAATFLNAADPHTIVLTKGTTDGINLVAQSYGRSMLKPGDEILLSWLEHHSNIVPWQLVAEQTGAAIKVVPINDAGELDLDEYARAAVVAHEDRRGRPRLERARHDQSGQGDDRAGARRRRGRARRRRAGGAAPGRSTCRRSTATSTCCRATRCSARPAPACSTDAGSCSRRCRRTRAAAT